MRYNGPVKQWGIGHMPSLETFRLRQLNPAALATERRAHIPQQFSLFIHLWRILAVAAVFVGHATKPDILFDVDVAILGRATIPSFLVISGFFATLSMSSGGRFIKKVARRYYTMLAMFIPAMVLIFFMDLYMIHVDAPILALDKFDPSMSFEGILFDIFNLLTFSGEYWSLSTFGQGVFSNQAIWIIDYIMAYTVMTAAIYLLSGWIRVTVLLAAVAIAGFPVLLLAPLWFAGVLAFEVQRRSFGTDGVEPDRWHPITLAGRLGISLSSADAKKLAFMAIAAAVLASVWVEVSGAGEAAYFWSKTLAPHDVRQYLGMAKRYPWQWIHVPSLFVVICAARLIFDGHVAKKFLRPIQIASQYTFPIFALHFSTMYFLQALMPDYMPRHDALDPYVMIASTFVICVAYGYLFFRYVRPYSDALSRKLFG